MLTFTPQNTNVSVNNDGPGLSMYESAHNRINAISDHSFLPLPAFL